MWDTTQRAGDEESKDKEKFNSRTATDKCGLVDQRDPCARRGDHAGSVIVRRGHAHKEEGLQDQFVHGDLISCQICQGLL